ncbi:MAG: hypothetical protein ACOYD0_12930 [Candidatus Nanopelagicales bacterium]
MSWISPALILGIVLVPVWYQAFRQFRWATSLLAFSLASLASGLVLAEFAPVDRVINAGVARSIVALFVASVATMCVVLWARTVIPLDRIVLAYSVGLLIQLLPEVPASTNPWKFLLSVPITLIVVSLLGRLHSRTWLLVGLVLLTLFALTQDSRAYFGLLAGFVLLLQERRADTTTRTQRAQLLAFGGVSLVGLYYLASSILISGTVGDELRQRTLEQIQRGGSLLLGGRPEASASLALGQHFPMGFGLGAQPRLDEILIAKQGLSQVGLTGPNGYVTRYMFGQGFELHSIIADFWAWFGLVGLAFALYMGGLLIWSLTKASASRSARPAVIFAGLTAVWFLLFGPPATNLPMVFLALAISLPLVREVSLPEAEVPDEPPG